VQERFYLSPHWKLPGIAVIIYRKGGVGFGGGDREIFLIFIKKLDF